MRSDVGGQKLQEIGSRRAEIKRSDVRDLKSEVRGRMSEMSAKRINSAKDLKVYQTAYALAMEIFIVSKRWPPEERYSLTDQIRRSSRSVCANLKEAWAKRRYEAHFISKLTDSDAENSETGTWLDFAKDSGYLTIEEHASFIDGCTAIGAMLGSMIKKPGPFLIKIT